jgi:hypothetical protein
MKKTRVKRPGTATCNLCGESFPAGDRLIMMLHVILCHPVELSMTPQAKTFMGALEHAGEALGKRAKEMFRK